MINNWSAFGEQIESDRLGVEVLSCHVNDANLLVMLELQNIIAEILSYFIMFFI